tara:strand:- start:409 stop:729 length:321 start_codon:yes stop_codon:yes gene_type:complete
MTLKKIVDGIEVELSAEEEAKVLAAREKSINEEEATAWLRHRTEGKVTSHKDEDNNRIIDSRESGYPAVTDQLDMLFHEMTASGSLTTSGSWYKTIKTVKDANPKP